MCNKNGCVRVVEKVILASQRDGHLIRYHGTLALIGMVTDELTA